MKFVTDPQISVKINEMKRRVRWQESLLREQAVVQTKLVIDDQNKDNPEFSFMVIGDTGCDSHLKHHPQRKVAEMMLNHNQAKFVIHTGDVVYQVGSSEYYQTNFIEPYREYLVGGEKPEQLNYDRLTFRVPFFLVPGNHDYYDLPLLTGILAQATWLPRRLLRGRIDLDVGWHGSNQGNAYAKAFLDYLLDIKNKASLKQHLDSHYSANHQGDRCLHYQPQKFTRLPNRYYTFRYGGIDFFALDSNTFNEPLTIPDTEAGADKRAKLLERQKELTRQEQEIQTTIDKLSSSKHEDTDRIDDLYAKLEHLAESQRDITKQLNCVQQEIDWEQLTWLKDSLIASWQDQSVRGRIIFLHHPPYVTESTKWNQGQTLAVRDRLRQVFDDVVAEISELVQGRSVVDIVLSGHAHCMEHLSTKDTGHGDSDIDWIICGGSGHSLRRQREEGASIYAEIDDTDSNSSQPIGQSNLFIGRNGSGRHKKRPYSFLRIDVKPGEKPQFVVNPYVAEWHQGKWNEYAMAPFAVDT